MRRSSSPFTSLIVRPFCHIIESLSLPPAHECTLARLTEIVGTWAGDVWCHTIVRVAMRGGTLGLCWRLRKPDRNQYVVSLISICMNLVILQLWYVERYYSTYTMNASASLSFPSISGWALAITVSKHNQIFVCGRMMWCSPNLTSLHECSLWRRLLVLVLLRALVLWRWPLSSWLLGVNCSSIDVCCAHRYDDYFVVPGILCRWLFCASVVAAIFVVSTLLVCVHVGRQQTFLPDELYHVGQLVLCVIYYGLIASWRNAGFILLYHVVTWPGLRLWRWSGGKSEISIFVCLAVGSGCGRFRAARHFRLGSHVTRSHVSHFPRVHMSIVSCSVGCFSVYISVDAYSHCGWGEIHYLLFIIAGTSSSDWWSIGEFSAFETMHAW